MMKKAEILAPAGGYDSLLAAVRCGADAVYLGADTFNARRNAENFDDELLEKAVRYCHARNVKVYLTLNTLISDDEMKDAVKLICLAGKIGIDAFIIQDLGIIDLIKKYAPSVRLHASTQMSVQTVEGIKLLENLGFSRVVLPRELSKDEIKTIAENTSLELEIFVHGALCMSVSGQCYFSAMLGSRSGNRGLCAQPCRLPFCVQGGTGHDLSLKDNSLIGHINELSELGVTSFKIEGRMKRPEYVAAAVTACRNSADGKSDKEIEENLKAVFSRSGFTDGYYKSELGKNMFGMRTKEDVVSADKVLNKLEKLYEKETPKTAVNFEIKLKENKPIFLKACAENYSVELYSERVAEKAIKKEISEEDAKTQLNKCGGTQFFVDKITTDIDGGLSIPISELNKLRRTAIEQLEEKIVEGNTKTIENSIDEEDNFVINRKPFSPKKETYIFFDNIEQMPDNIPNNFKIILPLSIGKNEIISAAKKGYEILLELPRGIFSKNDVVKEKVLEMKSLGIKTFVCPTLDSAAIAKYCEVDFITGFGSNIFNTRSLEMWKTFGAKKALVSFELTSEKISNLGGEIDRGIIIYGKVPLMLTRNCPSKNGRTCLECKKTGKLTDRKEIDFDIDCTNYCSEILNSYPLYLIDKKKEFPNIDFFVLRFTKESKDECEKIIGNYLKSLPPAQDMSFTRGLYFRGVL